MAAYNKFNCFVADQNRGVHNLPTDTVKILLTNTVPSSTMALVAELTDISGVNGYTAGGIALTVTQASQSGGTYRFAANGFLLTGTTANSTAGFGPFQYAVQYNGTASSGPLISWWDYGSAITVKPAETFAFNPNSSTANGTIFTET